MAVRNMNQDPSIWENFYWEDLSRDEQQLWAILGWNEALWNANNPPPSANMEWDQLTLTQRNAAERLGFTPELWDGFEDQ